MKNILVTGSTGFLGGHVVNALKDKKDIKVFTTSKRWNTEAQFPLELADENGGHRLCDLSKPFTVHTLIQKSKPDIIVHLAGCANPKESHKMVENNIVSTANLLKIAPDGCKIIFSSSLTAHGECTTPNSEPVPTNLYGVSKLCCEDLIKTYKNISDISHCILRFCTIVGKGVTHGVVRDLYEKIKLSGPLEILGASPGSNKSFIYVYDAVKAVILAIDDNIEGTFNICSADTVSVDTIANTLIEHTGIPKDKKWLGEETVWPGDNRFLWADNSRFKKFGFEYDYESSIDAVRKAIKDILDK